MGKIVRLTKDGLVVEDFNKDIVDLDDLYKYCNCDTVDRLALEDNIDIWFDDEGKLASDWTENAYLLLLNKYGELVEALAGDLLFCSFDKNGDSIPLTDKQVEILQSRITNMENMSVLPFINAKCYYKF